MEILLAFLEGGAAGFLIIIFIIFGIAEYLLPLLFWIFIIKVIISSTRRTSNHKYFKENVVSESSKKRKDIYVDVTKDQLQKFNTDNLDSLKDYLYNIFYSFENAYNNLDYNVMRTLSTKQLFQNYYTGITLDLKVGKKRIIEGIERKNVIIYELDSTIAKQTVSAVIEVTYYNYLIDKNGNIVSGNRLTPITEKFEVTFRKDFEKEEITKCPNCGANTIGNKCEYCRTIVKNVEFKIHNIKRIVS